MSDLSPRDCEFLELAKRAPGPTGADRARIRRGIAAAAPLAGLGAFAAASKAAGAGSAGLLKSTVIFLAAAGLGSTLVIGGVAVQRISAPVPRVEHAAPPRAPAAAPAEPPAPPVIAEAVAPAPEPVAAPPPTTRRTAAPHAIQPAPAPAAVPSAQTPPVAAAAPPSPCTLEREAQVLQTAQRLLGASARESLSTLDTLEHDCPGGELVEERRAARALALCALGRRAEGRTHLEWLRRTSPASPALQRVSNACEEP